MRIYISVDMEGISGICSPEYVLKDGRLYNTGRALATRDVNAAVAGAFEGGADEVIVADMHASSCNLLAEELDPRAMLIAGTPHSVRFPFLDDSVSGMALIGYHSMAGTMSGNLEHTMSSKTWFRCCVNGVSYGETAIDAEIAAWCGVPVVMVSGDDYLCTEAENVLGSQIEKACVKLGIGRQSALCLSPEEGNKRVRGAMRRACERLKNGEVLPTVATHTPAKVAITYKFTPDADEAAAAFGARRIDGYTVEMEYPRIADMYGGLWNEKDGRDISPLIRGE